MNAHNVKVTPDSLARHEPSQELRPGRLPRLAWLPVPLLLAAIITARATGSTESYMSEPLRLVLSFTFYTLVSLGTLFLIGRSFLASGTPGLLLLECGVILWSLAGTVGDAVSHGDANIDVTIFNTGMFLAGLCHLAGAILSLRPQGGLRAPPLWLGAGCALALGTLWLVAHAALANWLPVFFIPGQGGTLVRYCVLISAIAMFVLSASLLLAGQREARAPFTSWYALALLLLAVGLFGVMIQLSLGSVVNWLGRTGQWLGGVYLLLAASAALRESDLPLFSPETKLLPERYSYGVAIALVIAATAVRFALSPALGTSSPLLTFYPAVILAALYGGLRTGLLTTVLSALIVDYFLMEPVGHFTIASPTDWLIMLFFLLPCTMISFAIEAMHKARARLVLHQDHLEESVKNRTAELEQEVVERRRAEETLRESEERLRALTMASSDSVYRMSPDWKEMRQLDGRDFIPDTNEPSRNWLEEYIPSDDQPHVTAVINEAIRTKGIFELEHRVLRVDGTLGWTFSRAVPLLDENGAIVEWFGAASDITERKRAAEQLASDLEAMSRLQKLNSLLYEGNLEPILTEIVDAAIAISGADFGNIQLLDPASSDLKIVAQRGFPKWWLDFWNHVSRGHGVCGTALERGERVIVEDVEQSPIFIRTEALEIQLKAGVRAVQSTPLMSRSGRVLGMFSTHFKMPHRPDDRALRFLDLLARHAADAIDRVQADEALKKAHDELELRVQERTEALRRQADLIELSHEAIIVKDLESRILFWNRGAEETYGFTKTEAEGNITHSFLKTQFPVPFDEYMAALTGKGRWEGELIHTKKDGSELTVLGRQVLQRDEADTPIAVMEINIDITERKRTEIDLQASEERWATTLASIGDAVIATDTSGRIMFMNAVAEALTGWTRGDALQKLITDVFHIINEQTRLEVENPIVRVLQEGVIVGLANHTLLVKKDGTEVPIDDSGAPIRDKEGKIAGVVLIFRDITERKQAEEKLTREMNERAKTEEQLRQAQKMEALGTMSGGIAHDFNNMLAAIIGFTELVAGHAAKGSRDERHLARIMESSLRGRDLVRQMLTFSRKAEQEKKPLLLSSIVKETVKLIRATTPTTISIRVNAFSESGLILADPTQMQQVLMNLCTNAAYAMREKGGTLDIQLNNHSVSPSNENPHGIKPGLYTRLTVRDTGAGMSHDVMSKIFDPFFTTKKLGEGTGLGLSVVHGIVKQHDGYIAVESEPGKGSIFTVYFPQVSGELEADAVSDDELPTGSERILFVDDEEALVEMGEDILAELGYEVTSRMSSREALALFLAGPSRFDLVITDQTMPEMTGVELAKEVLAIRADMPVIMCTGFSYAVNEESAKAAGIRAFAMKPLTKREIAKTIRKVLDM